YDGKGQTTIRAGDSDSDLTWRQACDKAWSEIGARPAILEGFVDFVCEISVIGARGANGSVALYDPAENRHAGGILRRSSVPARISETTASEAGRLAARIL